MKLKSRKVTAGKQKHTIRLQVKTIFIGLTPSIFINKINFFPFSFNQKLCFFLSRSLISPLHVTLTDLSFVVSLFFFFFHLIRWLDGMNGFTINDKIFAFIEEDDDDDHDDDEIRKFVTLNRYWLIFVFVSFASSLSFYVSFFFLFRFLFIAPLINSLIILVGFSFCLWTLSSIFRDSLFVSFRVFFCALLICCFYIGLFTWP